MHDIGFRKHHRIGSIQREYLRIVGKSLLCAVYENLNGIRQRAEHDGKRRIVFVDADIRADLFFIKKMNEPLRVSACARHDTDLKIDCLRYGQNFVVEQLALRKRRHLRIPARGFGGNIAEISGARLRYQCRPACEYVIFIRHGIIRILREPTVGIERFCRRVRLFAVSRRFCRKRKHPVAEHGQNHHEPENQACDPFASLFHTFPPETV